MNDSIRTSVYLFIQYDIFHGYCTICWSFRFGYYLWIIQISSSSPILTSFIFRNYWGGHPLVQRPRYHRCLTVWKNFRLTHPIVMDMLLLPVSHSINVSAHLATKIPFTFNFFWFWYLTKLEIHFNQLFTFSSNSFLEHFPRIEHKLLGLFSWAFDFSVHPQYLSVFLRYLIFLRILRYYINLI